MSQCALKVQSSNKKWPSRHYLMRLHQLRDFLSQAPVHGKLMPSVVCVHLFVKYYLPIKRKNSLRVASDVRIEPNMTEVIIEAFCF